MKQNAALQAGPAPASNTLAAGAKPKKPNTRVLTDARLLELLVIAPWGRSYSLCPTSSRPAGRTCTHAPTHTCKSCPAQVPDRHMVNSLTVSKRALRCAKLREIQGK